MQNNKGWISQLSIVLTGQIFSLMGSGIVQFAIIWWITFSVKSASVLAVATIMGVLPVIIFSPVAGVVADRYNRKLVMIVADAFTALVTFVFFLIMLGSPSGTDVFSKEMIYVLLFLRAIGSAFHQPAFESSMPLIIPKDHLVRGAAITQMLRSGINMVAPMLGAVLFGVMGLKYILMIDVVTAVIAIFSLTLIHLPDLDRHDQSPSTLHGYISDLKLGLKYIYNWKGLLALIIVFALANFLLAPMLALISKVIYLYFSTSSSDFAFFQMALSIGLILGSLSLSVWGGTRRKIVIVNVAQVLCGLFIASVAGIAAISSELFGLVLVAAVLIGVSSAYVNSPVMAILQAHVDKSMLGRVMAVGSMLCSLAMPLSLIITGPLADLMIADPNIGLLPIVWIPGLLSTLLGVISFFIPGMMQIEAQALARQKQPDILPTAEPDVYLTVENIAEKYQ